MKHNIKQNIPNRRERNFIRIIFFITVLEFIGGVIGVIWGNSEELVYHIVSSVASLGMVAILFIPIFTKRILRVIIPNSMYVIFVIFCFCSIILGDVNNFFAKFVYWDNLLHLSSGILLSVLGFILINTLNNSKAKKIVLNPFFVAAASFCFVMTVQSIWEICEFLSDEWMHTNAQTYMATTTGSFTSPTDVPLMGHEALRDTMMDFILDGVGGLVVSIIGYFDLKHGTKRFTASELEILPDEPKLLQEDENNKES
ncbi:MAG: hypothetical protein RR246_02015 [Clostridia bacterium]